jgi:transposase
MRGLESGQQQLFYQIDVEAMIPGEHPLRRIRVLVDEVLDKLSVELEGLYADRGRAGVPPERLLRALILQKIYSVRSERQLEEQLTYNFLYRWFVGLQPDEKPWNHSTVSKNQRRLLDGEIARSFLYRVVELAEEAGLLSNEHFTVDGTLLESVASLKSLKRRGKEAAKSDDDDPGNPTVNFHGERRRNETHVSQTDPEARLYKKGKGKEARLYFMGHKLMDNREGFIVEAEASLATGKAEVEASEQMCKNVRRRVGKGRLTLGEDKGYDQGSHVRALREMKITPHIAVKQNGSGLIDGRTYCQPGYEVSQRKRKRIEETFGWDKVIGGLRRLRHVGLPKADFHLKLSSAAYNLVRMVKLIPTPA